MCDYTSSSPLSDQIWRSHLNWAKVSGKGCNKEVTTFGPSKILLFVITLHEVNSVGDRCCGICVIHIALPEN